MSVCLLTSMVQILPPTSDCLDGRLCCCEWTRRSPLFTIPVRRELSAALIIILYFFYVSEILCSPSLLLLSSIRPCCSTSCSLKPYSCSGVGSRRLEITFTWLRFTQLSLSYIQPHCCCRRRRCTDSRTLTRTHAQMHARALHRNDRQRHSPLHGPGTQTVCSWWLSWLPPPSPL